MPGLRRSEISFQKKKYGLYTYISNCKMSLIPQTQVVSLFVWDLNLYTCMKMKGLPRWH